MASSKELYYTAMMKEVILLPCSRLLRTAVPILLY